MLIQNTKISNQELKDAASRLIEYISKEHKVRLSKASALEAIASVFNVKDWNTLSALSQQTDMAEHPIKPNIQKTHSLLPYYSVSNQDWFRHTSAIGNSNSTHEWANWQLNEHITNNHPGIFVNVLNQQEMQELKHSIETLTNHIKELKHSGMYQESEQPLSCEMLTITDITKLSYTESIDSLNSIKLNTHKINILNIDSNNPQHIEMITTLIKDIFIERLTMGIKGLNQNTTIKLIKEELNIILNNFEKYPDEIIIPLVAQARSVNIAIIGLNEHKTENLSINANMLHKLYLNGANQELQDEITEKLQKAKMVLVKDENTITIM